MSIELQLLSPGCQSSDLVSQAVSKSASKELSPFRRRFKNLWQCKWLGLGKDQELCIENIFWTQRIQIYWLVFGWEIEKNWSWPLIASRHSAVMAGIMLGTCSDSSSTAEPEFTRGVQRLLEVFYQQIWKTNFKSYQGFRYQGCFYLKMC